MLYLDVFYIDIPSDKFLSVLYCSQITAIYTKSEIFMNFIPSSTSL